MGFFLTTPFDVKPSDVIEADLGHPHIRRSSSFWPILESKGVISGNGLPGKPPLFISAVDSSPLFVTSEIGRALDFDGSIQWAKPRFNNELSNYITVTGATLSVWVKIQAPGQTGDNTYDLSGIVTETGGYIGLYFGDRAGAGQHIYCYNWDTSDHFVPIPYTLNQWHHITLSHLAGVMYGYRDGVLIGSTPCGNTAGLEGEIEMGRGWRGLGFADMQLGSVYFSPQGVGAKEALDLFENSWAPFGYATWTPVGAPGVIALNIDGLNHAHPVKEVDLGGNYTLGVDSLGHVHPLDQSNLSEVGANFPLDIDELAHQHPVDQVALSPDLFLDIDKLTHGHLIDEPEFTIPPNDLDIDDLSHAHPVDESNLGGIYDLNIQGLSHEHPVDESNLGGLEGDDTALKTTSTEWLASAGVQLANTSGVDTINWHVVEIVFNGVTSVLTIDGVKVEGDAGIRALEAVIVGAGLSGIERANIQLGEFQLYSGEVAEVDRVAIRDGLTTKWITG